MSVSITLREYEDTEITLDSTDVMALDAELRGKVSLRPTGVRDRYVINPGPHVGVIRLPGGLTLHLLPKVPLFNVMWMISEVERLADIDYSTLEHTVRIETFEDILEPIAQVFTRQVEHLIDRGLYRTYIDQEENLTAIRGRIDFREDLNHNTVLRHRTWCRFTEYSWDVPENQVIRQVVRKLAGWGFSPRLTHRLMALNRQMEDISRSHFRAVDLDRFHYSRQSEHYQPIHRYCRLFLDGFSLSEQLGESPFDGFVIDMNVLFERFIATKLDQVFQQSEPRWSLQTQSVHHLFRSASIQIRPDMLIRRDGRDVLVADTKYFRADQGSRMGAYYQMIAYCTVLGFHHAVLVHPRDTLDVSRSLPVRNSPITIHEYSVNLQDNRMAIEAEITLLAELLVSLRPMDPSA